jgi:hypothetical protein
MAGFHVGEEFGSLNGVGGVCALCHASKRTGVRPERIITTDQITDMPNAPDGVWPEMWLEFCESCVTEMAQLLGMKAETEYAGLIHNVEQLMEERESAEKAVQEAMALLNAYRAVETAPEVFKNIEAVATVQRGRRKA